MSPDAIRQRRSRALRKRGIATYRIRIPEVEVIAALIASGALSEAEALRPKLVENAIATVLTEWSRRWVEPRHA